MRAGEKRKFYRNMEFNGSARKIGVVGLNFLFAVAPFALPLVAVVMLGMALSGHNPLNYFAGAGASTVLAAASPALALPSGGNANMLTIFEEAEKLEAGIRARSRRIESFDEKYLKFLELVTNKAGMRSHVRAYALKEAEGTSDFPILFGTVLERQLLAKYTIANVDWRSYIATGTQSDFRPTDAIGIFGLQGQLTTVRERGEYKQDEVLGEGKVSITLQKFGAIFGLGWEALINDDLGAFNDVANRLNNRTIRTEYFQATSLFVAAAGPHTGLFGAPIVHPIDGANVTNKGTLAFSVDNLGAVCNSMRRQKDSDGEPIIIDGFHVVVPPALEIELWKALNPAALIATGVGNAAAKSTSANVVVQNLNITGHVNPYLPIIDTSGSADKTWYVFATQGGMAPQACKMNFLRGHESPELVMKAPDKVTMTGGTTNPLEGNFAEDAMWWRVRHVMGGNRIDPRLAFAQVGP